MKLPCLFQYRILKQAVQALFSRPYTTKFPRVPYEPDERFRGRPRFNEATCIGCGACAKVCPAKCIEVRDDTASSPPRRTLVQHFDACICCGQCERHCTTGKGITMSREYDNAGFAPEDFEEKVEKELVMCELCGSVIAPADQLRWIAERLGPLAFANPTLVMLSAADLGLAGEAVRPEAPGVRRADRLSLQCPHCRRKTARVA